MADQTTREESRVSLDFGAIRARMEAADEAVNDICTGSRRWLMSVPADRQRDHDLIIGAALDDIKDLLAALEPVR